MKVDLNNQVGYRLFLEDGFDDTVECVAKKLGIGGEEIFLDIGGNVGATSIPVALELGCEVVAVEASKIDAALLLENAFLNDIKLTPLIICATDK